MSTPAKAGIQRSPTVSMVAAMPKIERRAVGGTNKARPVVCGENIDSLSRVSSWRWLNGEP